MQAAHHSVWGHTLIILYEIYLTNLLLELSLRETLEEVSPSVIKHLRLNDHHALYICLYYLHLNLNSDLLSPLIPQLPLVDIAHIGS